MSNPRKNRLVASVFAILLLSICSDSFAVEKTRLVVLTDIESEPDDAKSMQQASFEVPDGRAMLPGNGTMHIILALTDKELHR